MGLEPAKITFANIPEEYTEFSQSKFVIVPVPYDRTTSYYSGSSRGPNAILEASTQVELFDDELQCNPYQAGIFLTQSIESPADGPEKLVQVVEETTNIILAENKTPILLGGEHTVSVGAIRACKEKYSNLTVIQIDAHADLRDEYEGSPYSHACVMRRVLDMGCTAIQIGIRSHSEEEFHYIQTNTNQTSIFYARDIVSKPTHWIQQICSDINGPVYITFDLDGLDPSIMPATGTPEPGGLLWYETLALLKPLMTQNNVVGFDIVELAPIAGMHAPDFLAARLLYKSIGYISNR